MHRRITIKHAAVQPQSSSRTEHLPREVTIGRSGAPTHRLLVLRYLLTCRDLRASLAYPEQCRLLFSISAAVADSPPQGPAAAILAEALCRLLDATASGSPPVLSPRSLTAFHNLLTRDWAAPSTPQDPSQVAACIRTCLHLGATIKRAPWAARELADNHISSTLLHIVQRGSGPEASAALLLLADMLEALTRADEAALATLHRQICISGIHVRLKEDLQPHNLCATCDLIYPMMRPLQPSPTYIAPAAIVRFLRAFHMPGGGATCASLASSDTCDAFMLLLEHSQDFDTRAAVLATFRSFAKQSGTWLRSIGQRDVVGAIMRGVDHPDKHLYFVKESLAVLALLVHNPSQLAECRRWRVVPWLLSIMRSSHGVYSTLACQALLPLLDSPALRQEAVAEGAGPALANCLRGRPLAG